MLSSVTAWLPVHLVLASAQLGPAVAVTNVTAVSPTQLELEVAPTIDLSNATSNILATLTPTPLPRLGDSTTPTAAVTTTEAEYLEAVASRQVDGAINQHLQPGSVSIEIEPDPEMVENDPETPPAKLLDVGASDTHIEPAIVSEETLVEPINTIPMLETPLWDRVRQGFTLPHYENKLVRQYEKFFAKRPDYLARVVNRGSMYLPYIVKQLEYRGMPMELALLPIVESAFNPFAKSHANALGMWQFIAPTAERFGVKRDWWYDGRRDVIDSTQAALDYLQFLHEDLHGDWLVAIAAYNGGEHRMHREIKRNRKLGKTGHFDNLRMKRETRHYVPKLIALKNIFANPARFNVVLPQMKFEQRFETVWTEGSVDIAAAAKLAGLSKKQFRLLNPGFKRASTPPEMPARLLVPVTEADRFRSALAVAESTVLKAKSTHRVRRGESLSRIAQTFGLSVGALMQHNGLNSDLLQVGQRLTIPTGASSGFTRVAYQPANENTHQQLVYRVRGGDTLSSIAERFNVLPEQLADWNRIRLNDLIHRGQRIVIYIQS